MNLSESPTVGTVLIVSRDNVVSRQISDALREYGLSAEVSIDVSAALARIGQRKFEAVVVDSSLGSQAAVCLQLIRASKSNRTAVPLAVTGDAEDTARSLRQGFSFALEKPLTPESISHTLKVAYGLIVRERRRYFRYPVAVPAVLNRKEAPEVFARTINISEHGVALSTVGQLVPGSEALVQFTLPDPPLRITATSRVRWNNEKGEMGLSFVFLPCETASELQAWLARKLERQIPQEVLEKFWPGAGPGRRPNAAADSSQEPSVKAIPRKATEAGKGS